MPICRALFTIGAWILACKKNLLPGNPDDFRGFQIVQAPGSIECEGRHFNR